MKQYHKLYYWKPELLGEEIWAFDKLDGQNLRFEANFKRGFYKFGSRTQMISDKDEQFGVGVNLFMEKYSEPLMNIFAKNWGKNKFANFTVFAELVGENSFAGRHDPNDELDVILFDVWIYQKGWVQPQKFIDEFGHLGIPNLIYQGELDDRIIKDIQENKFNLKEGVIAKGVDKNDTFMMKIKTKSWLKRVKNELGEKALLEDMDGNKKHLIV
jgi:hypothetical protein